MTDSKSRVTSIFLARFRTAFLDATQSGSLGGSEQLRELATLAHKCLASASQRGKVVFSALECLFTTVSEIQDERLVSGEQAEAFCQRVCQPVMHAIEFLAGDGTDADAVTMAVRFIDLELETTGEASL